MSAPPHHRPAQPGGEGEPEKRAGVAPSGEIYTTHSFFSTYAFQWRGSGKRAGVLSHFPAQKIIKKKIILGLRLCMQSISLPEAEKGIVLLALFIFSVRCNETTPPVFSPLRKPSTALYRVSNLNRGAFLPLKQFPDCLNDQARKRPSCAVRIFL